MASLLAAPCAPVIPPAGHDFPLRPRFNLRTKIDGNLSFIATLKVTFSQQQPGIIILRINLISSFEIVAHWHNSSFADERTPISISTSLPVQLKRAREAGNGIDDAPITLLRTGHQQIKMRIRLALRGQQFNFSFRYWISRARSNSSASSVRAMIAIIKVRARGAIPSASSGSSARASAPKRGMGARKSGSRRDNIAR